MIHFGKIFRSRLLSNIVNLFVFQGFSYVIPIILIPFLINHLGLNGYGLVNFVLVFTFFFQVINEFGFDLSNVPHIVKNKENNTELSIILSSIGYNRLSIYFFTSIFYYLIVFILPTFREHYGLYILGNIRILALTLTPIWFFRSMEDMKILTRIAIPIKIITFLPIFVFVKSIQDINWVMFFYALECIGSAIVSYIVIKKYYGVKLVKVRFSNMKYYFRESIPYFTSYLLMRIYQNANTVILKFTLGDVAVGLYTAADKIHNAYIAFVSPLLTQVLYPYFTRIKDLVRINRVCILVIIGNIITVGLIYLISPYVIKYFIKESSEEIIKYFYIFLIGIIVDVPNNILGYSYLGVLGLVKKVNETAIYASIIYGLCVLILIFLKSVTIESLIWTLIIVQFVSMVTRIYYIIKAKEYIKSL